MMVLMYDGHCSEHPRELPPALHPMQLVGLVKVADSYDAAVITGNMSIVVGVSVLCFIGLCVLRLLSPYLPSALQVKNMMDAQGLLRFPSVALFVLLFLYQGTVYSSMRLVVYGATFQLRMAGVACTVPLILIPPVVAHVIKTSVPRLGYYRRLEHPPKPICGLPSRYVQVIIGAGEWVSARRDNKFVARYQTMMRSFKQDWSWFVLVDFAAMWLLACATMAKTPTWRDCGHVKMVSSLVCLISMGVKAYARPFARHRDNLLDPPRLFLQALALIFMAAGFYSGSPSHIGFKVAPVIIMMTIVMLLFKVFLDLCTEVVVFRRRARLQKITFEETENNLKDELLAFNKAMESERVYGRGFDTMTPKSMTGSDDDRLTYGDPGPLSPMYGDDKEYRNVNTPLTDIDDEVDMPLKPGRRVSRRSSATPSPFHPGLVAPFPPSGSFGMPSRRAVLPTGPRRKSVQVTLPPNRAYPSTPSDKRLSINNSSIVMSPRSNAEISSI
eukprot:TRINITY_DN11636_c1_g1_i1.p1 TRINITY_DN11636_c1_g1~~TRINITY_DN11636_c1_g1_i1.p1  ORF type:complete len:499 (+),score=104.68 TRINITY_DN11636_c1_g1_i1:199-1695(+)